jgi:hypothetical protein
MTVDYIRKTLIFNDIARSHASFFVIARSHASFFVIARSHAVTTKQSLDRNSTNWDCFAQKSLAMTALKGIKVEHVDMS